MKETYEIFMYIREGVKFYTPSERIAGLRSESGKYYIIECEERR